MVAYSLFLKKRNGGKGKDETGTKENTKRRIGEIKEKEKDDEYLIKNDGKFPKEKLNENK